jgi:hypothetical protein
VRVHRRVVDAYLVAQVMTSGASLAAHLADDIAATCGLAGGDGKRGQSMARQPLGILLCTAPATRTFWGWNRAPVFRVEGAEVAIRNRWVRLRQGRHTLEAFHWKVDVRDRMPGDWLVEFRSKTRNVCGFVPK